MTRKAVAMQSLGKADSLLHVSCTESPMEQR
jgi:hypothetical protein